jgi:hypothetical protein
MKTVLVTNDIKALDIVVILIVNKQAETWQHSV